MTDQIFVPEEDPIIISSIGSTPPTTTTFSLTFFDTDDIKIYVDGVLQIEDVDYTIVGTTGYSDGYPGGTITWIASISNCSLAIVRDQAKTFTPVFASSGPFDPTRFNLFIEQIWGSLRELQARVDRSIRAPVTDTLGAVPTMGDGADRANTLLGFDASGDPIFSSGTGGIAISAAMTPVVQAASLALGRAALGVLRNERLAKTANYTVANADAGKTISCGSAPWTLTFSTISGGNYDADFWVLVTNTSTSRAILMSIGGGTNFFLWPGQTALVYNDNSVWKILRPERWKLTGGVTFYVDTANGSDSNDGLASGSGNALATVAAAISLVCTNLDFANQTVTIQFASATYTTPISMAVSQNWVGGGTLHFKGDEATPSNVTVSTTSASAFTFAGRKTGIVRVSGMKLTTTTAGHGIASVQGCYVNLGAGMEYGACGYSHINAQMNSTVEINNNYTISGNATIHWECDDKAFLQCTSRTITLTGTPAFSVAFCRAYGAACAFVASDTFSGSATGTRYSAYENGVIRTGGGGATYLPGNAVGSTATGGQYT